MFEINDTDNLPELKLSATHERITISEQAWRVTMEKWETLREACRLGKIAADGGRATCGLCVLYFYGHSEECDVCPIAEAGHPGCTGTPYEEYRAAVAADDIKSALQADEREILFLTGLHLRVK